MIRAIDFLHGNRDKAFMFKMRVGKGQSEGVFVSFALRYYLSGLVRVCCSVLRVFDVWTRDY